MLNVNVNLSYLFDLIKSYTYIADSHQSKKKWYAWCPSQLNRMLRVPGRWDVWDRLDPRASDIFDRSNPPKTQNLKTVKSNGCSKRLRTVFRDLKSNIKHNYTFSPARADQRSIRLIMSRKIKELLKMSLTCASNKEITIV